MTERGARSQGGSPGEDDAVTARGAVIDGEAAGEVEVVLAVDDAGRPTRTAVWVGSRDDPELDEFRRELCR